jgi:hypothetical protein
MAPHPLMRQAKEFREMSEMKRYYYELARTMMFPKLFLAQNDEEAMAYAKLRAANHHDSVELVYEEVRKGEFRRVEHYRGTPIRL